LQSFVRADDFYTNNLHTMFGFPARLLARIDAKKALPRFYATIQWLRIVEFACSVAIMGIFLSFSVNLPKGFTPSKRLVVVWALV
jgi:hypothetical protein